MQEHSLPSIDNPEQYLVMPPLLGKRKFLEQLGTRFSIRPGRTKRRNLRFFDTFEWSLYESGLVLTKENNRVLVQEIHEIISSCSIAETKIDGELPRFWWDFPDSDPKVILGPKLKLRALIDAAEIVLRIRMIEIKNEDDKTVARLQSAQLSRIDQKINQSFLKFV